jgi:KUP system potassium uptake protein
VYLTVFGSTLPMVASGGWFPLALAASLIMMMYVWSRGTRDVARRLASLTEKVETFVAKLGTQRRVPGTAVVLAQTAEGIPPLLLHHVRRNKALHELVALVTLVSEDVPRVSPRRRVTVEPLGGGLFRVIARYGFAESPHFPDILDFCATAGVPIDPDDMTVYVGRTKIEPASTSAFGRWRARAFAALARNAQPPIQFFHVPTREVVEIGLVIEL